MLNNGGNNGGGNPNHASDGKFTSGPNQAGQGGNKVEAKTSYEDKVKEKLGIKNDNEPSFENKIKSNLGMSVEKEQPKKKFEIVKDGQSLGTVEASSPEEAEKLGKEQFSENQNGFPEVSREDLNNKLQAAGITVDADNVNFKNNDVSFKIGENSSYYLQGQGYGVYKLYNISDPHSPKLVANNVIPGDEASLNAMIDSAKKDAGLSDSTINNSSSNSDFEKSRQDYVKRQWDALGPKQKYWPSLEEFAKNYEDGGDISKAENLIKDMGFKIENYGEFPEDEEEDQNGWNTSKEWSKVDEDTYNKVNSEVQQKMKEAGLDGILHHAWSDGYSAESYPLYFIDMNNNDGVDARMRPDGTFAITYYPTHKFGRTLARGLNTDQMIEFFKKLSGGDNPEYEQKIQSQLGMKGAK